MKPIQEEHNFVIVVIVITLILIVMFTPIGNTIRNSIIEIVGNISEQVNN